MWFSRKQVAKSSPGPAGLLAGQREASQITTKRLGDAAESLALAHLLKAGLKLVDTNYRTPGRGGGEIDLIMRAPDGTLVFIEVRQRASQSHGGAGASISATKQQRIIFAARHYLMRLNTLPPCRLAALMWCWCTVIWLHQKAAALNGCPVRLMRPSPRRTWCVL